MILSLIQLINFRRHINLSLNFSDKINYIVGINGIGKTSILEAIYFICTTKGYKSKSDGELLNFGEETFEVEGIFKNLVTHKARILYAAGNNRKNYLLDEKQVGKFHEIIGRFPVIILTPEDHNITQGLPAYRRKFVDSAISQINKLYLETLLGYNKILRHRAALLYRIREGGTKTLQEQLEVWNEKLVETGVEIINYRTRFIAEIYDYIKFSYQEIVKAEETPDIQYSFLEDYDGTNTNSRFYELLASRREEEIRRGTNQVGPHRDDFIFTVNARNLRNFGSQGQHKTFQIALKFAQYFYMKEKTGENPIFLLDDVFGELDLNRAVRISELLQQAGQVFITLTDFAKFNFLKLRQEDSLIKFEAGETVGA
jgi:DNA replication and repair protein RecF